MGVHAAWYRVDASRPHPLRTERNDACRGIIMARILLLPKGIHDRLVVSGSRLIVAGSKFLKEEEHDLVRSPSFRDKYVIHLVLGKLFSNMHEILDKLNTQARAASIFRQDYGVSREDALYLFTWQREGEYHKR